MKISRKALQYVLASLVAVAVFSFLRDGVAQGAKCTRPSGPTPLYERIFLRKGDPQRPSTVRGVDDLDPAELYPDTARIDLLFSTTGKERTNRLYSSCLGELSIGTSMLKAPGPLLSGEVVEAFLRTAVAVPKESWLNHMTHTPPGRYIFTLVRDTSEWVVDLRPGGSAIVFYPDKSYRCVMPTNYSCLKRL